LQSILNHIIDGHIYEYSSITTDSSLLTENTKQESNILDTIDSLLNGLNEPNYSIETKKTNNDSFAALLAAADSCLNDEKTSLNSP
jgi:hypothetical protein